MHFNAFVAATSLAATAQAILLPPDLPEADVKATVETIDALPPTAAQDAYHQMIKMPCPGCPVRFKGRAGMAWERVVAGPTTIEFNLTVESNVVNGGTDRLLLNGHELYPSADPFGDKLTAVVEAAKCTKGKGHHGNGKHNDDKSAKKAVDKERKKQEKEEKKKQKHQQHEEEEHHKEAEEEKPQEPEEELKKVKRHNGKENRRHSKKKSKKTNKVLPQDLGYGLAVHPVATNNDQQLELISLNFQVIEVGSVWVDVNPTLEIMLVKDKNGALAIAELIAAESQAKRVAPLEEATKQCSTMLCRWIAIMKYRMKMIKGGCRGMMNKMGHGRHGHSGHVAHQGHDARPHRMHGHMHHRSWKQLLNKVASHVLLPVLVGVIAGVSVSLLGMAMGTVIIAVWRTFFRRRHHHRRHHHHHRRHQSTGHAHHHAALCEIAINEEKSGLLDDQEPPPSYPEADKPDTTV